VRCRCRDDWPCRARTALVPRAGRCVSRDRKNPARSFARRAARRAARTLRKLAAPLGPRARYARGAQACGLGAGSGGCLARPDGGLGERLARGAALRERSRACPARHRRCVRRSWLEVGGMTLARADKSPASGGGMADAVLNALPHPVITVGPD